MRARKHKAIKIVSNRGCLKRYFLIGLSGTNYYVVNGHLKVNLPKQLFGKLEKE